MIYFNIYFNIYFLVITLIKIIYSIKIKILYLKIILSTNKFNK